jgi:hypothetical protein
MLIAVILPALSIAADLNTKVPTFAKDIAPILQEKCQACHRAGSMGQGHQAARSNAQYAAVAPR